MTNDTLTSNPIAFPRLEAHDLAILKSLSDIVSFSDGEIIFRAGDVRSGSAKRVGFAVGDGSMAVTCVNFLQARKDNRLPFPLRKQLSRAENIGY